MISSISYLHSQQIAHRDVGPGNFVIARNGRVVLIDFGISIKPGDEVTGRMHYEVGTGYVLLNSRIKRSSLSISSIFLFYY